jgi:hypothetical protein
MATWWCEGNPVDDDIRAIAAAIGVDFAFDGVLNREQQVVAAFGGSAGSSGLRTRCTRPASLTAGSGRTRSALWPRSRFRPADLGRALAGREHLAGVLREAGFLFATLDLDGLRSGSMNALLPGRPARGAQRRGACP